MDTSKIAMQLFAKADMLNNQHRYESAMNLYDSIFNNFKDHSLNDEILLRKANVLINLHQYDEATLQLKLIETDYPTSMLIDNALFLLGQTYEKDLKNIELAKSYYKKILFNYPGSIYVIDARNRFRKLSGNTNQNIIKDS
jgi:outer membrane protein assembly factor BamD (BamD/ComL family)